MNMKMWTGVVLGVSLTSPSLTAAKPKDSLPAFWVDDDLGKGFSQARRSSKPLMIVFRCVP